MIWIKRIVEIICLMKASVESSYRASCPCHRTIPILFRTFWQLYCQAAKLIWGSRVPPLRTTNNTPRVRAPLPAPYNLLISLRAGYHKLIQDSFRWRTVLKQLLLYMGWCQLSALSLAIFISFVAVYGVNNFVIAVGEWIPSPTPLKIRPYPSIIVLNDHRIILADCWWQKLRLTPAM